MTRRWGLTAGYRWALAAAVPLGALLGIVVGVVVLVLGNADWREFSTPGAIVSSFAGYVAFGALVAAIAVTRDTTTPYLVLFLAVPTAVVAGSAAAVVENLRARGRRQRRKQRERSAGAHGEFSPSTDRGAPPTVET